MSEYYLDESSSKSVAVLNAYTKQMIINGQYSLSATCGRSKVWEVFAKVISDEGHEIPETVACRKCFGVYKYTGSTSNIVKHKCYMLNRRSVQPSFQIDDDSDIKQESIDLITEWTIKNCRSFKIIGDPGLKKLAKFLLYIGANFGADVDIDQILPHPTAISHNISSLYKSLFIQVKDEVTTQKVFGYAITCNIWTDNFLRISCLSCTMHYVKEGTLMNRFLAIKPMKGDTCTGTNIRMKLTDILNHFGCNMEEDMPIIVTDKELNMIEAFQEQQHMYCVNHLLYEVIDKTVKSVPDLNEMVAKCNKLLRYFKKSSLYANLDSSSICPTRWNTIFYLLKSIEANWTDIAANLIGKDEADLLKSVNVNDLNALIELFAMFDDVSKKFEGTHSPTIHLTIPYLSKLKKTLLPDVNDSEVISQIKRALSDQISTTVLQNLTKYHKISLFLFPPTNKLLQFSPTEKLYVIDECKNIMKTFVVKNEETSKPSIVFEDDAFTDFIELRYENSSTDQVDQEIQAYLNMNVAYSDDFDCLAWWNMHKSFLPLLFKVSCKIFCAPATSAASEQTFSVARSLIAEKRCNITTSPDNVNKIMFLHANNDL